MDLKPVKLVLLGETGVGKTSIIQRFVYDDFREDPQPTIGANFTSRVVKPPQLCLKNNYIQHVWPLLWLWEDSSWDLMLL